MEPYYEDDWVTLYHGDCLELADVWTGADVLVTDPPYGMAYRDGKGVSVSGDIDTNVRDAALAAWPSDKPSIAFGTWKADRPSGVRQVGIWDKCEQLVPGAMLPVAGSHEEFYLMGQWPKLTPGGRVREGGNPSRRGSVFRVPGYNPASSERPDHPTPKPPALMMQLVALCPPGVIADPFAGSGSTLIAARNLGRKVIGVELEEKYCELIAKRLQQQTFDFAAL